jgi:hypothetical protein
MRSFTLGYLIRDYKTIDNLRKAFLCYIVSSMTIDLITDLFFNVNETQ